MIIFALKRQMEKIPCKKKCQNPRVVRNGHAENGKQLYKCKNCGASFVLGDKRGKLSKEEEYLMLLLKGKLSYSRLAQLFWVSKPAVEKLMKRKESKAEDGNFEKQVFYGEQLSEILEKEEFLSLKKREWLVLRIPNPSGEIVLFKKIIEKPRTVYVDY